MQYDFCSSVVVVVAVVTHAFYACVIVGSIIFDNMRFYVLLPGYTCIYLVHVFVDVNTGM